MPTVQVAGKQIRLVNNKVIGKGGEADIYDIGGGRALKLYKPPQHPDYQGLPVEQQGAKDRLVTIQKKLPALPKSLPPRIVTPIDFATDQNGQIVGYTMRLLTGAEVLLRYGEKKYRQSGGITNHMVMPIFSDLCQTVKKTHQAGLVFGDFNDLNVLVTGNEANIVDIDSAQFGSYLTNVFTARFVDPLLCDPKASTPSLSKPHNELSDWYAYAVMLFQSLLYVDPYGGVYQPRNPKDMINHAKRPLKRITVFHPEVKYPKAALPWKILPDDLLDYFTRVFEKDERVVFPEKLLNIPWVACPGCGMEHARMSCPYCAFAIPAVVLQPTTSGSRVSVKKVFATTGVIVYAAVQNGKLLFLYNENSQYKREDGMIVAKEPLAPQNRFRISGNSTFIARQGVVRGFHPDGTTDTTFVDNYRGVLPVYDANENAFFWSSEDALLRQGRYGPERIGNILSGQTLFWVGPTFGFGFYRAGPISLAFVFDANSTGVNDNVRLDILQGGQFIDSTAVFTHELCWFFVTLRKEEKTLNRCTVVSRDGAVLATAEADAGDSSWLSGIRGKAAAGNFLFAPTDEGIVRVQPQNGTLAVTTQYPETEPYVDTNSQLFIGSGGIFVVNQKEVHHLSLV